MGRCPSCELTWRGGFSFERRHLVPEPAKNDDLHFEGDDKNSNIDGSKLAKILPLSLNIAKYDNEM